MHSESINDLMAAVVRAQMALLPAKKDAKNPFFKSKYADLPAVWDALAPFRHEGIALVQCPADAPDGHIALETVMAHAATGQWIKSRLVMPLTKNDPQGAGSALTYARRYALGCMTGLVTEEDDDGNAASRPDVQLAVAHPKPAPGHQYPTPPAQPVRETPSAPPLAPAALIPIAPPDASMELDQKDLANIYRLKFEQMYGLDANTVYKELMADTRVTKDTRTSLYKHYTDALQAKRVHP